MTASKLTPEQIAKGYTACPCGKFAHVFRSAVFAKLPPGYFGELCPKCGLMMVAINKLEDKNA